MRAQATRILVVRVGAMGDVLHALPAVTALRRALPEAHIGWAVEPRWAALLQVSPDAEPGSAAMPLVDIVHRVETRLWSSKPLSFATMRSVLRLRRELRSARYDIAIDLQGSIRSAVIAKLSGARIVIGSAAPREHAAQWLYSHRVTTKEPHVVQQSAEIASAAAKLLASNSPQLTPARISLPVDPAAERWCDELLRDVRNRIVFLAPTAGWGAKQWPAERYGQLAAALRERGFHVLLNATTASDETAQQVLEAARRASSQVQPLQLAVTTIAQMIALLRRVSLVVAGDTGPLHMAAALGRPVVALFGPTDPARNGPFATPARVLRDASSQTSHRRHVETEAGLARISMEDALAAALELLHAEAAMPPHASPDENMKVAPEERGGRESL